MILNKARSDMSKNNQNRKRIGRVGWLPFWYGNKFNKRLVAKRVRRENKKWGVDSYVDFEK